MIVYFPGCMATYREQDIAKTTIDLLKKAGVEFTMLGEEEWCCGSVMLRTGNRDVTQDVVFNQYLWEHDASATTISVATGERLRVEFWVNVSAGGHEEPAYSQEVPIDFGDHFTPVGIITGGIATVQADDGVFLTMEEVDIAGPRWKNVTVDSFGDMNNAIVWRMSESYAMYGLRLAGIASALITYHLV